MPAVLSELLGSELERTRYVEGQFRRALDASRAKRDRLYQNLALYFGDQLPADAVDKAVKEARELVVYNLAKRKVQGLVGSMLQNNFQINYTTIDNKFNRLVASVQDMLLADQNSGNWDWQLCQGLTLGMISECVFEITTSTRESPLGNIIIECTQAGAVITDPNWRTNMSADMIECFKQAYLPPSRILELFPEAEDSIKAALFERIRLGREYQDQLSSGNRELWNATHGLDAANKNQDYRYNENPQTELSGDYQVLQYFYLEPTKSVKVVDFQTGLEFPDGPPEYQREWMTAMGISPDFVKEVSYSRKVLKVMTIIPGLQRWMDRPVEDKAHELQIGRMPFFPWSPDRINGDTRGIIDVVKDLQTTLNKRENLINNIIENSANGAAAVDPAIVDNDPVMKQIIEQNWSNPKFKFWTSNGVLQAGKNFFAQIPKSQPPNEVFAQINHLWEALDRVIPVNAAADGRTESSQESGVLFSMKQQAVIVAQTTLIRGFMSVLTEIGDAYFRAAKSYYSNVERTFQKPDGSTFKINEIIPLPTGDIGIKNDISTLQNLRTLVKMGPDSPSSRFSRRLVYLDLMKMIPANSPLGVQTQLSMLETLDLPEEEAEKLRVAGEKNLELAVAQADAGIAQAQQVINPPPPPAPAPAPGAPTEAAPPEGAPAPAPEAPANPIDAMMAALGPLMAKGA